ncbi:serine O-acetyltransferase EpsC, partial [Achromobacter xylosoxidans]
SGLRQARVAWRGPRGRLREDAGLREFPSQEALRQIIKDLCGALFPMRLGPIDLREEVEDFYVGHTIGAALDALLHQVNLELQYVGRDDPAQQAVSQQRAIDIVRQFGAELPRVRAALDLDVTAAYQGDPAAHSVDEVLLCYPGVAAMIHHRLANVLYRLGVPMLARIVAEIAHADTGIDIHPGATIGRSFFIDHGTGVVIGETAIIGDRVRLYQMVTLGAKRFPPGENGELKKGLARHPLIEDDVVIYAGATILGRVTIGKGSTIGGNVWLTRSVPPGSNVTQASLVSDMPDCGLGG